MKLDFNSIITVVGFILLIGSNLIWLLNSYSSAARKKYAAEREFGHLKRNQEQLLLNIDTLFHNLENHIELVDRDIQEIKFRVGGGTRPHDQ